MKKVLTLSLLFTSFAFAQGSSGIDDYVNFKEVKVKPGQTLVHILRDHGYDFNERDWASITRLINGLKGKELKAKIYLPPKFTMASVYRSRGRDIASEKNLCVPVSRAYVKAIYGTASNKYITFIDQMLARKYEAKKGESIKTILENDRFSYTNIDLAQRHVKHANNLASDELFKDQVIYLPFCSTSELRRDIASYLSTVKVEPKEGPLKLDLDYEVSLAGGKTDISSTQDEDAEVNMTVSKLRGDVHLRIGPNWTLSLGGSAQKVHSVNFKSDSATADEELSEVFYDGHLKLARTFGAFALALGYDNQNYFIVRNLTDVSLRTGRINRFSLGAGYTFGEAFTLFAEGAALTGTDLSGSDVGAGAAYAFGSRRNYVLTGSFQSSSVKTELSEDKISSALLKFAVLF